MFRLFRLSVLAGAALLFVSAPGRAQTLGQTMQAALARAVAATHTPGAAVSITCNGTPVWSGAAGVSEVTTAQPFTRTTLSSVASVTKMVTATLVLRMAEDGLLALDSPISAVLGASIPDGATVTIRNLLQMRSGYFDIERYSWFAAAANDPNYVWKRAELFRHIKPPRFTPGSRFQYSNVNFLLLSAIIDAAYPGGVAAAYRAYMGGPAGLGGRVSFARVAALAPRVAHGYQTVGGVTTDVNAGARNLGVNTSVWGTLWGDGGVVATADGLARFADALFGGRLLNSASLAAMQTPLRAGGPYGLGLERNSIDGHDWYGHVGAFQGYTAFIGHDPARGVTIAAVANALDADSDAQGHLLVDVVAAYDAVGRCGTR